MRIGDGALIIVFSLEPKLSLPGFAFAHATLSATVGALPGAGQ
jgi:hypothetical protein